MTLISVDGNLSFGIKTNLEKTPEGTPLEVSPNRRLTIFPEEPTPYKQLLYFTPWSHELLLALSLGEGNTPLIQLPAFRQHEVALKLESQNPTLSFKDRGSLTTVAWAKTHGIKKIGVCSTGNMGHSLAAYAAKAGLQAFIFCVESTPEEKIQAMLMHGAKVFKLHGCTHDEVKTKAKAIAESFEIAMGTGANPIKIEGYKYIAYEIAATLRMMPDYIVIPTSTGGLLRGIINGFKQLHTNRMFFGDVPKIIIAQARNCSPIVSALEQGQTEIIPAKSIPTRATAITSQMPFCGNHIIAMAQENNWLFHAATEEEIAAAEQKLAMQGIWPEPASATAYAAIQALTATNAIPKGAKIIGIITGHGIKTPGHSLELMTQNAITSSLDELKAHLRQALE